MDEGTHIPVVPSRTSKLPAVWLAFSGLEKVAGTLGFTVDVVALAGSPNGDCDHANLQIRITAEFSPQQRVKTLSHEIAHAWLHCPGRVSADMPQCIKECEAESVAYIIFSEDTPSTLQLQHYTYSQAKSEAELLCREAAASGQSVTIVNPGEVYGPQDMALVTAGNLVDFAKSSPVLVCHGGTCIAHVEDVAAGIVAALERGRPGERYILGGENLTVRQLAELTLQILGQKKRIAFIPNPILRGIAAIASRLRLPLPFEPAVVPYATLYWFMDNSKARSELGISFRSARETLTPTLTWLRDAGLVAT